MPEQIGLGQPNNERDGRHTKEKPLSEESLSGGEPGSVGQQERIPLTEEEKKLELAIAGARSFEELYNAIQLTEGVKVGRRFYTPGKLLEIIRRATHRGGKMEAITSKYGLRSKVWDLVQAKRLEDSLKTDPTSVIDKRMQDVRRNIRYVTDLWKATKDESKRAGYVEQLEELEREKSTIQQESLKQR